MPADIDLERLFKLRAAVGRFGEMDCAGWWNTQGVLGPRGAAVYKRGLPQTHFLVRVRVVSKVAEERSRTIFPASGVATLWSLPPALERSLSFQERNWAIDENRQDWSEFEASLASPPSEDLANWLIGLGLVEPPVAAKATDLQMEAGGKGVSVPVHAPGQLSNEALQLLALGHARGSSKDLVVPFIRDGLEGGVG